MLVDFQKSFTVELTVKFAINSSRCDHVSDVSLHYLVKYLASFGPTVASGPDIFSRNPIQTLLATWLTRVECYTVYHLLAVAPLLLPESIITAHSGSIMLVLLYSSVLR